MEMESASQSSNIQFLVDQIKKELFWHPHNETYNVCHDEELIIVSASAYDTAWLAMVPDHDDSLQGNRHLAATANPSLICCFVANYMNQKPNNYNYYHEPMFKCCLSWVLNNQRDEGFWEDHHHHHQKQKQNIIINNDGDLDTIVVGLIDAFTTTLACMVALRTWNLGEDNIRRGLDFIHQKAEIIMKKKCHNHHRLQQWFTLAFPVMSELAKRGGLHDVDFRRRSTRALHNIFLNNQKILEKVDNLDEEDIYSPLMVSNVESQRSSNTAPPNDVVMNHDDLLRMFQSPSATAYAYISTGNLQCFKYLKSLVHKSSHSVSVKYPIMDEDELVNLCMVDHVQRLGLAEHFDKEIKNILDQIYSRRGRHNINNTFYKLTTMTNSDQMHDLAEKLYKDSLSFRLLRENGYNVKPCYFDWFLGRKEMMEYMERNCEKLAGVIYSVYRATDLRFKGEKELENARSFSIKLLEKYCISSETTAADYYDDESDDFVLFRPPGLHTLIKHELSHPWISRLDRLDQRMWIEENNKNTPFWIGKSSFFRLSHNEKLMKLAIENYNFRQSIYAKELEELTSWSHKNGFTDIGFGRDKTAYSYFAIASSSCLPEDSIVRLLISKSAIIVTVADDFYDMEGTLPELNLLTDAVQRWDGKNLSGHGKTIFNALDDFVNQTAETYRQHYGISSLTELRDIWKETFKSWMVERRWSDSGYLPSMDEYLDTGMISIAIHTILLPASTFLLLEYPPINNNNNNNSSLSLPNPKPPQYADITKLLMTSARLLNDTQSYQKEEIVGKMNFVSLHLKGNPEEYGGGIQDSIAYVKHILDQKTREFLELVLVDQEDDIIINDDDVNGGAARQLGLELLLLLDKPMKQLHLSCMRVFHMFFNSTNLFDTKEELMHEIKRAIFIPIINI